MHFYPETIVSSVKKQPDSSISLAKSHNSDPIKNKIRNIGRQLNGE